MAWWQLVKRAEIDGTARDAGYCFERPDDWKVPPMDTVRSLDDINQYVEVPIAVQVKDEAILARLAQHSEKQTIGHGDDDVVRPLDPETKAAEREKIDAGGAQSAEAPVAQEPFSVAEHDDGPGVINRPEDMPARGAPVNPAPVPVAPETPPRT